jgi:phosphatidate cytidylyltransferase
MPPAHCRSRSGWSIRCRLFYALKDMRRILTAAVLIPLVLALVFWNSLPALTIASALVSLLATWEYLGLAAATRAPNVPRVAVLCCIGILFLATYFLPEYTTAVLAGLSLVLFGICAFRCEPAEVLPAASAAVFGLIYTGWSFTTLPLIAGQGNGPSLLLFLFLAVWSGDVAALYVGRSFGTHKLTRISPNKTWEGAIASVAGTVLVTVVLLYVAALLNRRGLDWLSYRGPVGRTIALAVLLNIAAQIGDLVESALKRGAGVKDSGILLPGHGGVLDRVDALLLAAPVLWYALLAQQAM